jgi:hypothetical protein
MRSVITVVIALVLGIAFASDSGNTESRNTLERRSRFTVVPPGPVTDRSRVELRLAIPNPAGREMEVTVRFYRDTSSPQSQIAVCTVKAAPQGIAYVRAWCSTENWVGRHRLVYQVEREGLREEGSWPLDVYACQRNGLPLLQGAWIEPFAAIRHCQGKEVRETERNLRESVRAIKRLGINTLILTYLEYQGTFFYPSQIEFYDRDIKRMARGQDCPFDLVETVLSQADREEMHIFLGLGRGGDTNLLWEFEKPGWSERNAEAIALGKRVAQELWERYKRHPSFYGWYFTHEMNDLLKSSAYYDPLADFCHALSPDKPVMVAPAGTPILDRKSLAESRVDIFAYQDAVGSGYVPYKNTFQPENRIAMLDEIFAKYCSWHAETEKHLWADLELWEMDGSQGYGGAFPTNFSRVQRQIAIESKYATMLTAYAYHGFMHDPRSKVKAKDERAVRLFEEYTDYLKRYRDPKKDPVHR